MKKSKFKTTLDLSFTAVSFACILAIFSTSPKNSYAIAASEVFALFIPWLIGASLAEEVAIGFSKIHEKGWFKYIVFTIQMIAAVGMLGCYRGIYLFFSSISEKTGSIFLQASLIIFAIVLVFSAIISFIDWGITTNENGTAQHENSADAKRPRG